MDAPKVFWKYYDLLRRKKITIQEFSNLSGLNKQNIEQILKDLDLEEKSDEICEERWYNNKNAWRA